MAPARRRRRLFAPLVTDQGGLFQQLPKNEVIGVSRQSKRERGIWQRPYWEHQIHGETDLARHIEYIHFNPVKHGWVKQPTDWLHSTLHGYIGRGIVEADWGRVGGAIEGKRGEQ